jgi:hypothetical protein
MGALFSKNEKEYGDRYHDHVFEQYKMYIEGAEKVSDRRQNANNYFVTINTALISLIGLCFKTDLFTSHYWIKSLISLLGIIICIIFYHLIRSYKQLNTGKFEVIHEVEKNLPLALYKHEWEKLGEGKDNSKYYPFSHIELLIPWIFGVIYFFLGVIFLIWRT